MHGKWTVIGFDVVLGAESVPKTTSNLICVNRDFVIHQRLYSPVPLLIQASHSVPIRGCSSFFIKTKVLVTVNRNITIEVTVIAKTLCLRGS